MKYLNFTKKTTINIKGLYPSISYNLKAIFTIIVLQIIIVNNNNILPPKD